ncbi:MAG: hypothetical protein IJW83_01920 [Clostridia bacterium]|nr:hypothetical protein [Clostridia bacterium]
MTKEIHMNAPMKKLAVQVMPLFLPNERKILAEINSFFERAAMYPCKEGICFLTDPPSNVACLLENKHHFLTELEWEHNEIYFNKSMIRRGYRQSIEIAFKQIASLLSEKFPNICFRIVASVQFGKHRNVNIHVYIDRQESIISTDLDTYEQPVMYMILQT